MSMEHYQKCIILGIVITDLLIIILICAKIFGWAL
jgi:hypothetical protein